MKETTTESQLAKAIINVMLEVEGIEKNSMIGTGSYAYKGVKDQDVKRLIGKSMAKHGLCILPIGITPRLEVHRWDENGKQKMSVFTEVDTRYLLKHVSGESQEVVGYGHGIDSQDKGSAKATTFALKNLLLYLFLIPTGDIEDTDSTHSEEIKTPPVKSMATYSSG